MPGDKNPGASEKSPPEEAPPQKVGMSVAEVVKLGTKIAAGILKPPPEDKD